jgi:hypothetical protein
MRDHPFGCEEATRFRQIATIGDPLSLRAVQPSQG